MRAAIDHAIQEIWLNKISQDYEDRALWREDTIKNAFYHHLRTQLGAPFLQKNRCRIYTEYYMAEGRKGRADLAVVQLSEAGVVERVLAVVEIKFKALTEDRYFLEDVVKVGEFIERNKSEKFKDCQYYLAFIQEAEYEEEHFSWLTSEQQQQMQGRVTELFSYDDGRQMVWKVRKHPMFQPLLTTEQALRDFPHPWFFMGGWALDLVAGEVTRAHHDVDVCIFREDAQALLHHLHDWEARVVEPSEHVFYPIRSSEDLRPPRHELHFQRGEDVLEILLIERIEEDVIFRRDARLTMPYAQFACRDQAGRPHVAPEWQLLFKARNPRPKDVQDIRFHARLLAPAGRAWLLDALRLTLPDSAFIPFLEELGGRRTSGRE